ncbi:MULTISPECIES: MFS transporter [Mycolicibacterium]|uniref:MFS transporter n=1 Tax=Mycolicibacterium TaxID=1866885 RepID=UPI000C263F47|nr:MULTISPECIES: MFS transporter [Mycolicibacterium]PJK18229.1 MFS transporter [Mycolicibacterium goodii]
MTLNPEAVTSSSAPAALDEKSVKRIALAGGVGTLIEYYDYALYGYATTVIAPLFFPSSDPVASLLSALAVFALSYVIRPVGGIVFGAVGDRLGRKRALLITILGVGVATSLVGILPTYATVGLWAPVMLFVLRLAQGFFAGGEMGGAATVISEFAPPAKRSRFGAYVPIGCNAGYAVASGAMGVVAGLMTDANLTEWGWRIPFLVALPLTIFCYVIRRRLPDMDAIAQGAAKHGFPFISLLRQYPKPLLKGLGLGIGIQGGAFIGSTFIAIYLVADLGYPKSAVYWITCGVQLFSVSVMPFTARWADRIGLWPVAIFGLTGYALLTYPALVLMDRDSLVIATLGYMLIIINMSLLQVSAYSLIPRLFPEEVRYTGSALIINLAVVIAGGTAPFIATLLVRVTGDLRSPTLYVVATSVIGLIAMISLRNSKAVSRD